MVEKKSRSYIVVFDIDNTLCQSNARRIDESFIRENHPECPIIHYEEYVHIFLPYLQILFDYLIGQGARVVFFSSAPEERNTSVIPELLVSFWGSQKYEALKSVGQFDIFSKKDMRKGKERGEGNYVKDLKVVIQNEESLSDVLLVDDDRSFCAHDQKPCMQGIDLMWWHVYSDEIPQRTVYYYMNGTYYMLGLFRAYFENEKYKNIPVREGIDQIIRAETDEFYSPPRRYHLHPFLRSTIDMGLSEVKKQVPNARFYENVQNDIKL